MLLLTKGFHYLTMLLMYYDYLGAALDYHRNVHCP